MSTEGAGLRYVVLRHEGIPEPHFDLMIEIGPAEPLWTFRCMRWPLAVGDIIVQLPDHRREYLDYEGPVSGGRGSVRRVEAGDTMPAIDPSAPPLRALHLGPHGRVMLRQVLEGNQPKDRWQVVEISA